jgi:DNA-binding NarL/FixJ family response regulator
MEPNQPWGFTHARKVQLITPKELETLKDVARGLSDSAIARRHHLSRRGVQSRISSLMAKLLDEDECCKLAEEKLDGVNNRCRLVFIALALGLFDPNELKQIDTQEIQGQQPLHAEDHQSNIWVLRTGLPRHY